MTPDGYMDAHDWAKCPHFRESEFRCSCCGRAHVKFALVEALLHLRAVLDKPIIINSGFRCPAHNTAVGGARDSQHLIGAAADIRASVTPEQLALEAAKVKRFDAGGIGVYPKTSTRRGWVHVDVRNGRARWFG